MEPLLSEWADEVLAPAERRRVNAHLAGCPDCRDAAAAMSRALSALGRATDRPAPDLWQALQARLEREDAMPCAAARELLPAALDRGALESAERDSVERHLARCAACAAEDARLRRALGALERAGSRVKLDLWPRFTPRLAARIACSQAEELLPAYLAGDLADTRATLLRSHLERCRACESSAASTERSLRALDGWAGSLPQVDLWPQFLARLEAAGQPAAPPARRASWWTAPSAWLRSPALRPALALALLAVALGARGLLSLEAPSTAPVEPRVSVMPPPSTLAVPGAPAGKAMASALPERGERHVPLASRREARRTVRHFMRPGQTPRLMASGAPVPERLERPVREVSHSLPRPERRAPETVRIARNDIPEVSASDGGGGGAVLPAGEERKVLAQMLPCLDMLAGIDEASKNPFGKETDAQ